MLLGVQLGKGQEQGKGGAVSDLSCVGDERPLSSKTRCSFVLKQNIQKCILELLCHIDTSVSPQFSISLFIILLTFSHN